MRHKQIIFLIVISALAGGIIGAFIFSPLAARAAWDTGPFGKFFENFVNLFFPQTKNTGGNPSAAEAPADNPSAAITPPKQTIPYAPTVDYEQAVIRAVEQASPAVVSIVISKNVPIIEQCPYNPFSDIPPEFQQFFGQNFQFYQPCRKGTRREEVGGGSGFIVSSEGLIVTNKHVVLDEKADYTVFTNEGKKYSARVLARDPAQDLAIMKISTSGLPVLRLGDSNSVKLGQTAIAIGNALGEFRNTVSVGVISGLSRSVTASGGGGFTERIEGLIQTDAAINPGNSGGPLLNLKGEAIGINVAMASGAENIGFAIPINQVKRDIESVKRAGKIITPYLGIRYALITPDLADREKLPAESGALVQKGSDGPAVIANSPADKAGIRAGDIILEINGEKITIDNSLALIIQKYNAGDSIQLKVLREGKEINLRAVLEERPQNL